MGRLQDKTAVITGASSGIGFATARRFVDEGAKVYITGRRERELEAARSALGADATAITGDAADLGDLDRLAATIREAGTGLDAIVINAGFVNLVTTSEATPDHFDRTFATNTRGAFFAVQKLVPLLRDGGSIVLIATSGHTKGLPAYATYLASKAALRSFARSWAAEFAPRGIRVNVVSPGPVATALLDSNAPSPDLVDAVREQFRASIPLGRLGDPEDIAAAILFLASDDGRFATGADFVIDGGQTQV
ncbi:glucose 1-dehydrogenase [Microbacterium sp. No. 7]|uniref:glucose 1-dehydrogenase n=1 Tax=Microbacterium sp. No. 7 TaxID=1714373 RepID=UPI0006D0DFE2|nr:glucose 1-dehydrogenase [Microbacterium sp. No. 7]ALJ19609.1 hypothetical protein AOA12_06665 [Microbacterium sp. No. 7]